MTWVAYRTDVAKENSSSKGENAHNAERWNSKYKSQHADDGSNAADRKDECHRINDDE